MAEKPGSRALIRAAYDFEASMEEWLAGLARAAAPLAEGPSGLGVMHSAVYRRDDDGHWSVQHSGTENADLDAYMRRIGPLAPPDQLDRAMRETPMFCRFSDWMKVNAVENFYRAMPAQGLELGDHLSVLARDGGWEAVLIAGMHSDELPSRQGGGAWNAAASHVIAALRLRRALGARPPKPEDGAAVVAVDGKVVHAEGDARVSSVRERLRRVVRHRERSQTRAARGAQAGWTPLIAGRWTLVDCFDGGDRRYYVAVPNAPHFENPNALATRERTVASMAAHGLSNQEIAYALGLSPSTVATLLGRALTKLGLRQRSDLPILRQSSVGRVRLDDSEVAVAAARLRAPSELSRAEAEVASLAARGWTDEEIARRRGCKRRTVANQLRSVYRKLRVASRTELADRLFRQEGPAA